MDKFVKEIAKTLHPLVWSVLMMVVYAWVGMGATALAQTATLELTPASATAVNGPTTASQSATFLKNTNNPTGNTFSAYTPVLSVTASLSNQQFNASSTNNAGMLFGATTNGNTTTPNTKPVLSLLNGICTTVPNTVYTSTPGQTGTGIDAAANSGFWILYNQKWLVGQSTNNPTTGYYYGDLTFTFSRPVDNPVLHVADVGAFVGTLGYGSAMRLQTPGVTMSLLSGTNLTVTGNEFRQTTFPTTACQQGTGSILLSGTGITSVTFKIYMLGNGGAANWASTNAGDGVLYSFSVLDDIPNAVTVTQPTCSAGVANADGALTITSYSGAVTRVGFSAGSTYSGPAYASAVGVTALPMVLANNLPNPTTVQPYTIRFFTDATTYKDVVVTLAPKQCATADLSLTVSPPTASGNKGEQVSYTFTLTNAGPNPALNVTACIPIPPNTTFLSATTTQGSYNAGSTLWNLGTVPVGSQTITVTLGIK